MSAINFTNWNIATAALPATKQRVLLDTLHLVSEGSIQVVWGSDSYKGSPCLINAVGCMVKEQDESPTQNESDVVTSFDMICREMDDEGLTDSDKGVQYLTPIMADILIRNFGELKPPYVVEIASQDFSTLPDDAFLSLTEQNVESRVSDESASRPTL